MFRFRIILLSIPFFAYLGVCGTADSATFTVNSTADLADAVPGDGVCEVGGGGGVCTLRAAIQEAGAAVGPNTVLIPAGYYPLSSNPNCSYRIVGFQAQQNEALRALCVNGNVTIQGAGSANTVIDAQGSDGATCCGSYPSAQAFVVSADAVAIIQGVSIKNGLSNGGYTEIGGGGINNQGRLTVSDCEFTGNNGIPGGGGIANAGTLLVNSSVFTANTAGAYGGSGIYNMEGARATLSNSEVSFGFSQSNAGAIFNLGNMTVENSTLDNNSAFRLGGAIFSGRGVLTLTNVTVSKNLASGGSAIWQDNLGTASANNVTVAFNHSTNNTGAIVSQSTVTIKNSILAYNVADSAASGDCSNSNVKLVSLGHNLIQNIAGCALTPSSTDIYGTAPKLGALGENGGSTLTHALLYGSPAIGAGSPAPPGSGGTACAVTDQRGFFRPQGARCDSGAYERGASFTITTLSPQVAGNVGFFQSVIGGSSIDANSRILLRRGGEADITATSASVLPGNSSAAAVFDLGGAAIGKWDVVVTNADGAEKTLPGALTVQTAGRSDVYVELVGPSGLVLGHPNNTEFTLLYGNRGNVEALAVPIILSTPTPTRLSLKLLTTNPPAVPGQVATDWSQFPLYITPGPESGVVNVPLVIPVIPPGFSGAISFTLETLPGALPTGAYVDIAAFSSDALVVGASATASAVTDFVAGAQDYARVSLGKPIPTGASAALTAYVQNQLQAVVASGRSFLAVSAGEKTQLYSLAQLIIDAAEYGLKAAPTVATRSTKVRSLFKTLDSSDAGSSGDPCSAPQGGVLKEGTSGCPDKDPDEPIPKKDDHAPFTPTDCRAMPNHHVTIGGKYCAPDGHQPCGFLQNAFYSDPNCFRIPIVASHDPNDKFGPQGPGNQHFVANLATGHYGIEFENDATATAPAQQVVITDQLDTRHFDIATFSLGTMRFGSHSFTPPPGLTKFTTGLDLRPDTDLQVKIDAALDPVSGLVTWKFSSIDPGTGQLSTNPAVGFLPPDIMQPEGIGQVYYSVATRQGLTSGTVICNQADVVFDSNAPILTPTWCNTFDTQPPSSKVAALPSRESSATFTVKWSGSDSGSGVSTYTIYVADNGAAFKVWLNGTTATSAAFTGQAGHTYGFLSRAVDLVGNIEALRATADTTVAVGALLGDVNGDGVVNCADLAIVKASFGKTRGEADFDARADVNHDGRIDILDLITVARQLPAGSACQ